MGLQTISEQLHCGQWEPCCKRIRSVEADAWCKWALKDTKQHHHINVKINIMLMIGTFDLSDGHCDTQNGLHTHSARQRGVFYVDGDL